MIFKKTKLEGVYTIKPELKADERGYFTRVFCEDEFRKAGLDFDILQVNQSLTKKRGTIRGMHFQRAPKAENKIIQCLKGEVYDVVVDVCPSSPTFGKWVSEILNEKNGKMLFIPQAFAHGFQTLSDNCAMQYLMSEFYSPEHSTGIRWDDPFFNIKWPIAHTIVSKKDMGWPLFN